MAFLELRSISKEYTTRKASHTALCDVSFCLSKGEILGLLGVNGAGKTTSACIISTLIPPTSGEVLWKGASIYNQLFSYRRSIGFCPQYLNIDKGLTLQELLLFSGRYFGVDKPTLKTRLDRLIAQFDLEKYRHSLPTTLSGGYKQRFLLARTLVHDPKIVILDEPTVGLDPHVRRHLWQQILELKAMGVSIILTTHYLDEAEALCDRICILDKGRLRLVDTPKNVKAAWKKESLEGVFLALIEEGKDE